MEPTMTMYDWPDFEQEPDPTYRSKGVHKNRKSEKMQLDPIDRDGVKDSEKQAMMDAAAAATAETMGGKTPKIGVNEPIATGKKDVTTEVTTKGHAAAAEAGAKVQPGQYLPPTPGSGTASSYGSGDGGATGGGGMNVSINMDEMGFGGEGGGGGGGMGGGGGGMGGGMMSGLPQMIGQDTAAIDDTKDQADDALFEDDTDTRAHLRLGEALQGRG